MPYFVLQVTLANNERKLAKSIEKLHLHQTYLDDKLTELAIVQAEYDDAMQRRQVGYQFTIAPNGPC